MAGFTSIAPDQGIEHENRTLKVIGGIVGITQNEKALDKFFLIAPELSKLLHEFATEYGSDNNDKRTQHHEITGGKLCRMMKNARKLYSVNTASHSWHLKTRTRFTTYSQRRL